MALLNVSNVVDTVLSWLNFYRPYFNTVIDQHFTDRRVNFFVGRRTHIPTSSLPAIEVQPTGDDISWYAVRTQQVNTSIELDITTDNTDPELALRLESRLVSMVTKILATPQILRSRIFRTNQWFFDSLPSSVQYGTAGEGRMRVATIRWSGKYLNHFTDASEWCRLDPTNLLSYFSEVTKNPITDSEVPTEEVVENTFVFTGDAEDGNSTLDTTPELVVEVQSGMIMEKLIINGLTFTNNLPNTVSSESQFITIPVEPALIAGETYEVVIQGTSPAPQESYDCDESNRVTKIVTGCIEIKGGVVHWIVGTGDTGIIGDNGVGVIFGNSF